MGCEVRHAVENSVLTPPPEGTAHRTCAFLPRSTKVVVVGTGLNTSRETSPSAVHDLSPIKSSAELRSRKDGR